MINVLILTASPRKNGNTNALVKAFAEEVRSLEAEGELRLETVNLYDKQIEPCHACRQCQRDWEKPCCILSDDLTNELFDKILQADLIVMATPIYAWYCTAPAKALLDRCVYALNKYYGLPEEDVKRGPSIWAGKTMALITTCGYPPEKGADLWEEGVRRYCKHSALHYGGMLCERHMGYNVPFMDEEKEEHAKAFARDLIEKLKG